MRYRATDQKTDMMGGRDFELEVWTNQSMVFFACIPFFRRPHFFPRRRNINVIVTRLVE